MIRAASTSPPAATMPFSTPRRLTFEMRSLRIGEAVMSRSLHRLADGGPDAGIGAAPADIAPHGAVDFLVARGRRLFQQGGRLHDLAGLAVAALRHGDIPPRLLEWMVALRVQALDRRYRRVLGGADRCLAGPDSLAIEMDGAGAAGGYAAAELGAGQTQLIPQVPEQRHLAVTVELLLLPVNAQLDDRTLSRKNMTRQSIRPSCSAGACRRHDDVQDVLDRKIGTGLL